MKFAASSIFFCSVLCRICVFFNIFSSVHRNSKLKKSNKTQQYADIYLLLNYATCFGCPPRPSSGVHETVVAASGTDRTVWEVSGSGTVHIYTQTVHRKTQ